MNKRFDVLDGFRGIAALMVAVYHLHVSGFITELNLVKNSYLFVEFFFVLSGFVIAYSYTGKLNSMRDLKLFMKKRFARLWPLHIFVTIFFIPFALANIFLSIDLGDRFSVFSFFTNIFLIQALNINEGVTWNIPSWSISVEFYTYLIFGLIYILPFFKKLFLVPIAISLVSLLILYFNSSMGDTSTYAIFRCTYSFFLGVVAFKLYHLIKVKPWMEVAIISVVLTILFFTKIDDVSFLAFLMPVLFFLIILVFSHECGRISELLINKYLKKLGLLSFSIYLIHTWFISSIKALSKITEILFDYQFMHTDGSSRTIDLGIGYFNDLLYIPYIFIVLIASSLTYKYIERPCQKKINDTSYTFKKASSN